MRFGLRQIIFLLLLFVLPLASYFAVFEPRNKQVSEIQHEIRRKRDKLVQLETATRQIADLGAEIDKLAKAIELVEQKLPAQREVEVILQQVWELATKHRLTPKRIRTDKPVVRLQYSELPIKMTIVGNFDGFYSFLLDLEKLRRVTRMPNMKLIKLKDEEGQMQADVLLNIFYETEMPSSHTAL